MKKSPGTVVNDTSYGTLAWSNPDNARVSDNAYATAVWTSGPVSSNYLKATNFGFAVPSNATILGITVTKEGSFSGSGGGDSNARLVKGGVVSGDTKTNGFGAESVITVGSSSDLWGLSLTPADVNASDFGVVLYTDMFAGANCTISIDHITITVHYNYSETAEENDFGQEMVLAVAKQGKNALTSQNPNDFLFHSNYNTFKILKEGTLTSQTVSSDPTTFSVAHEQGGLVSVYAFAKFPDGYVAMPREIPRSGELERYFELDVDATNISFVFYKGATANYSVDIKYFVFEAPI